MAVDKVSKRVTVSMALVVGQDEDGKDITKNVNLTGLRGNPDTEKIMNVVGLAEPVLDGTVGDTTLTEVSRLETY